MGGGGISEATTQHTYSRFPSDGTAILSIKGKEEQYSFTSTASENKVEFIPDDETSKRVSEVWPVWEHYRFARKGQEEPDFSDVKITKVTYHGDFNELAEGEGTVLMKWEAA